MSNRGEIFNKMKMKTGKKEGGQSMFEVVVAIAISALIIVTIVSLVSNSIRNAVFSRNNSQAASYGQEATEWLRTERDNDIATFITKVSAEAPATTTYCLAELSWPAQPSSFCDSTFITGTEFSRKAVFSVRFDPVSGKTVIEADIGVSWTDAQGLHQVTNATSFTDWRQR